MPVEEVNLLFKILRGADEVWLGYNANDDLVEIRKRINDKWYRRQIEPAGVSDLTVVKWDKYKAWEEI